VPQRQAHTARRTCKIQGGAWDEAMGVSESRQCAAIHHSMPNPCARAPCNPITAHRQCSTYTQQCRGLTPGTWVATAAPPQHFKASTKRFSCCDPLPA
jgi:hypothetical protein